MGDLSHGSVNLGGINCGDCNAPDPDWASLNRGLLLCKECCFVHRSLGPQYSRVKYLKGSHWNADLKKMVLSLAASSANHVWEHLLLDPSKSDKDLSIKKPGPTDSLETKRKFIQLKHLQYQFVLRSTTDPIEIRNQELHSTVRTGAIDTTLRLLASGADPNFFHPEKGTRPIHVAARNGQGLQVELLYLHGAHANAPDYLGQTPVEHALAAGHKDLAQRIIELRYELTDQLSYFVCKELPDHTTLKHIVIPNAKPPTPKQIGSIKNLPANVLEQLAADLYDEVERRQTEKYLLSSIETDKLKFSIAFLPVNPNYPSVRNQTRQKFARLADEELNSLITLVLTESKRRHCNGSTDMEMEKDIFFNKETNLGNRSASQSGSPLSASNDTVIIDDDYPLYDSVASDEDLILAEQQTILSQQRAALEENALISSTNAKPISTCDLDNKGNDVHLLKSIENDTRLRDLEGSNELLKQEVKVLRRMVSAVIQENLELKSKLGPKSEGDSSSNHSLVNGGGRKSPSPFSNDRLKLSRPTSMCDPRAFKREDYLAYGRPAAPEVYLPRDIDVPTLVQETTRRIVELIKVLIEYSTTKDVQGMQLTVSAIYSEVQDMTAYIVLIKDAATMKFIRVDLENVMFQVLKMKSEIPLFTDLYIINSSPASSSSSSSSSGLLIQKVKQLCYDVGAAMKQLMSSTS